MGFFSNFLGGVASALPIVGDVFSQESRNDASNKEYERQKEFAQSGIRWRVADAKAAGIHPIYAIGANTPTYSPQAAVGTDFGLSAVGQNIGRAIEAKQTRDERLRAERMQGLVAESQANYYNAAAKNQLAQADLAGQRSVAEAMLPRSNNYVESGALLSERAVRSQTTQRQPPMPETDDYKEGNIIRMIGLLEDPKGRLVSLTNTQNYHDNNEDVPIVEALPFLEGLTWDARAKITREPIKVGNKWYAHNGSEYKQIDVKTYKPYWKNWFMNKRVPEVKSRNRSQSSGGIRAFYGG